MIETIAETPTKSQVEPVLRAKNLVVEYRDNKRRIVRAVKGIDLELFAGETLGIVGESGCGKSSTGKSLVQLPPPKSGEIWFEDTLLTDLNQRELRPLRRSFQLIFQDPISSLNPRRTALDIVAEPLRVMGLKNARERALDVLEQVGVDAQMAKRKPHELSGGQCQRISIARAIVQEPKVVICDEPVSALDVSVQAQVLNLLETMKREHDLSMIFISHDLSVVANISDRVAVMYLGRIVEVARTVELYQSPMHHYTNLLLSSIPRPGVKRVSHSAPVEQDMPKAVASEERGCAFADRCLAATDVCRTKIPVLSEVAPGRSVACHNPLPSQVGLEAVVLP